jgi:hypothetical protein
MYSYANTAALIFFLQNLAVYEIITKKYGTTKKVIDHGTQYVAQTKRYACWERKQKERRLIQHDPKVSVHLIQKVTSNVQSVPRLTTRT